MIDTIREWIQGFLGGENPLENVQQQVEDAQQTLGEDPAAAVQDAASQVTDRNEQ